MKQLYRNALTSRLKSQILGLPIIRKVRKSMKEV
jgi:hypothetical protein